MYYYVVDIKDKFTAIISKTSLGFVLTTTQVIIIFMSKLKEQCWFNTTIFFQSIVFLFCLKYRFCTFGMPLIFTWTDSLIFILLYACPSKTAFATVQPQHCILKKSLHDELVLMRFYSFLKSNMPHTHDMLW